MNSNPTTPPAVPPPESEPAAVRVRRMREPQTPLDPSSGLWGLAQALLRSPESVAQALRGSEERRLSVRLVLIAAACLALYGVTVGMFAWGVQLWAAPLKIVIGMGLSAAICLPSLFVFSCLSGTDARPAQIVGVLAGLLAMTGLLLAGFGPVSWIFAQSTESVCFMGGLHLIFWIVATRYAMRFLYAAFTALDGRQARHFVVWSVIFILVQLQMTTTLRPLIGSSDRFLTTEKKFFLQYWGENLQSDVPPPSETQNATTVSRR